MNVWTAGDPAGQFDPNAGHWEEFTVPPFCCACYEDGKLVSAPCVSPAMLLAMPIGMFHCPTCGAMLVAGCEHPPLCEKCADVAKRQTALAQRGPDPEEQ